MSEETLKHRPTSRWFLLAMIIPAAVAVTVFRIVPVVQGLARAFGQGRAALPAAPWLNALLLGLATSAVAFLLAAPTANALRSRPRWGGIARAVIVLPFFIPTTVLTGTLMSAFGVHAGAAGAATFGHWATAILVGVLQTAGVAAVLGASGSRSRAGVLWAVAGVVFVRFSTAISPPIDMAATMSTSPTNPIIALPYAVAFGSMLPGSSAAAERVWILQTAIHAVLVVGAFFLARHALRPDEGGAGTQPTAAANGTPVLYAWTAIVVVVLGYLVVRPLVSIGVAAEGIRTLGRSVAIGASFGKYAIVAVVSTVLAVFFVITTAYLLHAGRASSVYCGILLFVAAISAPAVHDYLFYRSVGMINTFYPYLVRGLFPVLMAFVLVWRHRTRAAGTALQSDAELGEPYRFFGGFVVPNSRAILTLALVQIALAWGYAGAVGVYMTHGMQQMSPATIYQAMISGSGVAGPDAMLLGLFIAAPPVILYLVFRRLAEDEVLWGGVRW